MIDSSGMNCQHDTRMHINSRDMMACLVASGISMVCGCGVFFFREGTKEIGVIPREPGTNVVFRTVLPSDANYVCLECLSPASSFRGEDRVTITLTNTSGKRRITLGQREDTLVAPHSGATLYEGSVAALLGEGRRSFWTTIWDGRVSCELHIQFTPAPTLPAPIRVFCYYSDAPM
jgi:hypothetical protein